MDGLVYGYAYSNWYCPNTLFVENRVTDRAKASRGVGEGSKLTHERVSRAKNNISFGAKDTSSYLIIYNGKEEPRGIIALIY